MPQKTLEDFLFDVEQRLKKKGHTLNQEAINEVVYQVHHKNPHVLGMIQSGQLTSEHIAEQAINGLAAHKKHRESQTATPPATLPLSTFAEGGLVNDQSGKATEQIRQGLTQQIPTGSP